MKRFHTTWTKSLYFYLDETRAHDQSVKKLDDGECCLHSGYQNHLLQRKLINTISPLFDLPPQESKSRYFHLWLCFLWTWNDKSSGDCLILATLFSCHQSWNTVILKHSSFDKHIKPRWTDLHSPYFVAIHTEEHAIDTSQLWRYCCCSMLLNVNSHLPFSPPPLLCSSSRTARFLLLGNTVLKISPVEFWS